MQPVCADSSSIIAELFDVSTASEMRRRSVTAHGAAGSRRRPSQATRWQALRDPVLLVIRAQAWHPQTGKQGSRHHIFIHLVKESTFRRGSSVSLHRGRSCSKRMSGDWRVTKRAQSALGATTAIDSYKIDDQAERRVDRSNQPLSRPSQYVASCGGCAMCCFAIAWRSSCRQIPDP